MPIQERQAEWRRRWEADTTAFILEDFPDALEASRRALAQFLSCPGEGLAFTRNATTGMASVVRSIEPWLEPGDEILTTTHDYNALRQTLEFSAARRRAEVVVAPVPYPIEHPDVVTRIVLDSVTKHTKLAVVDHITSPTGLVFPIAAIVAALEPDVPVLVDGAHGPGQVPVDLDRLGASWYVGNLHKWVCAPKGAAFLHTRGDHLSHTYPVVISHGWNRAEQEPSSRYHAMFDWVGTDDVSSWLVIPDVLQLLERLEPGGWPGLMSRNHRLALRAREILATALDVEAPAPDVMVGAMASLPLPDTTGEDPGGVDSLLTKRLIDAGFEALVMHWPRWPRQVLRVSAHHYNTVEEYEALATVLKTVL